MIRAVGLLALLGLPAAAQELPSTTDPVPGVSVIALLDDMTSLEGFVWFDEEAAIYCLSGIALRCGGRVPLSSDPLTTGIPLECGDGITGQVDVSNATGHSGLAIPKRAAGALSDGRSLVALFGPFRVMDGATCGDFAPSTTPEDSL